MESKLICTVFQERTLLRISRKEIAKEVGINYNTLLKIENGLTNPSVKVALGIARYLNKSVDELFKLV